MRGQFTTKIEKSQSPALFQFFTNNVAEHPDSFAVGMNVVVKMCGWRVSVVSVPQLEKLPGPTFLMSLSFAPRQDKSAGLLYTISYDNYASWRTVF